MTTEDVKKLAALAKIEIKDEELENYTNSLNAMFDLANTISSADTEGVSPITHVTKLRNVWRDDVVKPMSPEDFKQMMKGAPEIEGTFYKVEKVLDA
jgi:aspartyl-tRNA(Asn)/glutamyl-tRNA(Gln) amidotransferase subunit C